MREECKMNSQIHFKTLLKNKRVDAGLSQLQLGMALGVRSQAVGGWENGKCTPPEKHLPMLVKVLNINRDELIAALIADQKIYYENYFRHESSLALFQVQ
jgi:transcriptional regulator with XRE-family HTH domain